MQSPTGPNFLRIPAAGSFPTDSGLVAPLASSSLSQWTDAAGQLREVTSIETVISTDCFYDPITKNLLSDPVRCYPCGHIFERQTAMRDVAKNIHYNACPLLSCKKEVTHTAPHTLLKNMIVEWKKYNEPLHPPATIASNKREVIEIDDEESALGRDVDLSGRQVRRRLEPTEPRLDAQFTPTPYFASQAGSAAAGSSSQTSRETTAIPRMAPPQIHMQRMAPPLIHMQPHFNALPRSTASTPPSGAGASSTIPSTYEAHTARVGTVQGAPAARTPNRLANPMPPNQPSTFAPLPATRSSTNEALEELFGMPPGEFRRLPPHEQLEKIAHAVKTLNERELKGEFERHLLVQLKVLAEALMNKEIDKVSLPAANLPAALPPVLPPQQIWTSGMQHPVPHHSPAGQPCPAHTVIRPNVQASIPLTHVTTRVPRSTGDRPPQPNSAQPYIFRTTAAHFPAGPFSSTSPVYSTNPVAAPQPIQAHQNVPNGYFTEAQQSALTLQLEEQRRRFQAEQDEIRKKMEEQEAFHKSQTSELQETLRKQQAQLLQMQQGILQQQQKLRASAERSPSQPRTPESPLIISTPPRDGGFEAPLTISSASFNANLDRQLPSQLLMHSAALNTASSGKNPLHVAAAQTSRLGIQAITPLLRAFNINSVDESGNTPLHYAVIADRAPQFITSLLKKGADPNIQNNQGETPLHAATKRRRYSIVKSILKHTDPFGRKADLSLQDNEGKTALENHPSVKMRRIFQSISRNAPPEAIDANEEGTEEDEDAENNESAPTTQLIYEIME